MAGPSPDDASSGKCFSGIISRILCSRSLPTHPSDQLPDPDPNPKSFSYHLRQESSVKSDDHHNQPNNARAITNTPGVVARLMGLESMPDLMGPKSRPFGSFLRSKSVNFIDFLPQIGLATGEAQHRRVRTSVSFREAIGFDREKHDFFVVCFDSPPPPPPPQTAAASFQEVKKAKQRSVVKKTKQRSVEVCVPDTRRNDVSRKGDLDLEEKRAVKKPVDSRRVSIESKPAKKKKSRCHVGNNKIQPEYASILDRPKTSSPTKSENSRKLQKCSKKELHKSRNAVQQHRRRVDNNKAFINEQTTKTVEENVCRPRKNKEVAAGSNENTLLEICKFAEESAISEYWWVGGGVFKFEDSEEICVNFGQQILDGLVNDVVGELVKMHKSRI